VTEDEVLLGKLIKHFKIIERHYNNGYPSRLLIRYLTLEKNRNIVTTLYGDCDSWIDVSGLEEILKTMEMIR
jgi:hypothetical protein